MQAVGSGAFGSLRVWGAAIVWTLSLAEGAGFGAFAYQCAAYDPYAVAERCALVTQPLAPPAASWGSFATDLATLWIAGLHDGAAITGLFLAVIAVACASRMPFHSIAKFFSLVPIALFALLLFGLGYAYEVNATLSTGLPQISSW